MWYIKPVHAVYSISNYVIFEKKKTNTHFTFLWTATFGINRRAGWLPKKSTANKESVPPTQTLSRESPRKCTLQKEPHTVKWYLVKLLCRNTTAMSTYRQRCHQNQYVEYLEDYHCNTPQISQLQRDKNVCLPTFDCWLQHTCYLQDCPEWTRTN